MGCPATGIAIGIAGDIHVRAWKGSAVNAALAFDYHCSVFKEPRPDWEAGDTGPVVGRTPTPLPRGQVRQRASVSSTRAEPEGPASGPITLWADPQ